MPKGIWLGDYDKAIPDSHAKVMQNVILQSDYRGEAHSFPTIKGKQAQDIGMSIVLSAARGVWGKFDGMGSLMKHLYTRKHFTKHTFKSSADAL